MCSSLLWRAIPGSNTWPSKGGGHQKVWGWERGWLIGQQIQERRGTPWRLRLDFARGQFWPPFGAGVVAEVSVVCCVGCVYVAVCTHTRGKDVHPPLELGVRLGWVIKTSTKCRHINTKQMHGCLLRFLFTRNQSSPNTILSVSTWIPVIILKSGWLQLLH